MNIAVTRPALCAFAFLVVGLFVTGDALAQRGGGRGGGGRNRGGNQGDQGSFSIVRVGDEVQVVPKDNVEDLAKDVKKENSEALKAWESAKTAATSAKGGKFDDSKPEPKVFKVLAQSVEGRRKAEEMRADYQQKLLASMKGTYSVVQVGDEYKVLKKAEIDSLQRDLEKKFAKDQDAYEAKRRAAEKAGEKPDSPPPRRETMRILPKTFATEKEAHDYVADLERTGPVPGEPRPGKDDGRRGPGGGAGGDPPR